MTNHHFLAFLLVRLDDVKAAKVEGFAQWAREDHRWGARGERGGVRVCGGRVLAGRAGARAGPLSGLGSGGSLRALPAHTTHGTHTPSPPRLSRRLPPNTLPTPLLTGLRPVRPGVCPQGSGRDLTPVPAEPAGSPRVPGPQVFARPPSQQCTRHPNKARAPHFYLSLTQWPLLCMPRAPGWRGPRT